jgi:CxxC motif-containing protein
MLTTSVFVDGGEWSLVSVKSTKPVPKENIFNVLKEIRKTKVKAPVKSGQEILNNVANTDINIIATKTVKKL